MNAGCRKCSDDRRRMQHAIRRNERLAAAGKAADMTDIETAKRNLADCAAAGHRDPQKSANARWHPELTT